MKSRARIFLPLLFGALGLAGIATDPHFSTYRAVDTLRQVGSGICFGVALAIVFRLRR